MSLTKQQHQPMPQTIPAGPLKSETSYHSAGGDVSHAGDDDVMHSAHQNEEDMRMQSPSKNTQEKGDDAQPSLQSTPDSNLIYPQQPETLIMAILCCQQYLPPNATVRDCLEEYFKRKMREVDETRDLFINKFMDRLVMLEDQLLEGLQNLQGDQRDMPSKAHQNQNEKYIVP